MLNVTEIHEEIHAQGRLVAGVDVSKDKLDAYGEHADPDSGTRAKLSDQIRNRTAAIETMLDEWANYADQNGLDGLFVVCEPTGGQEKRLMQTARRLGHETAYVNGEHVAKASVIESGDQGKTDAELPIGIKSSGVWMQRGRWLGSLTFQGVIGRCS